MATINNVFILKLQTFLKQKKSILIKHNFNDCEYFIAFELHVQTDKEDTSVNQQNKDKENEKKETNNENIETQNVKGK